MSVILAFGATGQVGRDLARRDGVLALDRGAADLSDPAACAAAIARHAPRAVINAAAWTAVDAAETETGAARTVNAEAPGAMARACADAGIPMVQISTDYVFAGTGTAPHRPDDPVAPINAYGRTKAAGEDAVRASGAVHAILRTSWVVSDTPPNFVTTMQRLGQSRDSLNVVGDQIGGPTPAAALAEACLAIAEALIAAPGTSGTYHLSGAPDVSWADFARAIFAATGQGVRVGDIATADWPTPAARPANSRLDCSATERVFGIARPDWRAALPGILSRINQQEAS